MFVYFSMFTFITDNYSKKILCKKILCHDTNNMAIKYSVHSPLPVHVHSCMSFTGQH